MSESTKAFILRRKSYRETSYLIDFFSEDFGIVSLLLRGAKNKNNPSKSQWVNSFNLLSINFDPKKQSLSYVKNCETIQDYHLKEIWLYCGFYLNELLLKIFGHYDAHHKIFHLYHNLIKQLSNHPNPTKTHYLMRYFEIKLLQEIGFGIDFSYDSNRKKINQNASYSFDLDRGFIKELQATTQSQIFYSGQTLMALNQLNSQSMDDYIESDFLVYQKDALRLMRRMIDYALSNREITSRLILNEYLNL